MRKLATLCVLASLLLPATLFAAELTVPAVVPAAVPAATALVARVLHPSEQALLDKGYKEVKGEELRTLISGNTEESDTRSFYYHAPDGTFKGRSGVSGKFFSGKWMINEEGRICREWNTSYIVSGCGSIFLDEKTGDLQWYDADKKWYGTKIHPGNYKKY